MNVLVGCESSGIVREAFRKKGHNAWSCDLLDTDIPGNHYKGDIMDIINENWDMLIVHPPCTYLSNSGVSWLYKQADRWDKMREGAEFFKKMINANIKAIGAENPIQHKYARKIIGARPSQIIQPWMFGHPEQKATCLWLKNLPPLIPTHIVKKQMMALPVKERQRLHYLPPSEDRWKIRSQTFQGIAEAMADQWSEPLILKLAI